jgi:ADP-ribose pyrophosphatase YjhB (NUDIX family)
MTKKAGHGGPRPGAGRKPLTPEEQEAKRVRRNEAARKRRADAKAKAAGAAVAEAPATVPAAPKGQQAGAWGDARAIEALMERMGQRRKRSRAPEFNPFQVAKHPPRATPPKKLQMAMDDGTMGWAASAWLGGFGGVFGAVGAEGLQFLGYPYLSELAQRTEYRVISETIADDATRKWIDFDVTGTIKDKEKGQDDEETEEKEEAGEPVDPDEEKQKREDRVKSSGKMEKVKQLKDELARLELRDCMYRICRDDGFFGRSHLYLDFGDDLDKTEAMNELKTPIGDGRDKLSQGKVGPQKPLAAVRPVEPVWCYPTTYNAINPLRDDWYNPQVWYVMGREIHRSRLPTFVGHPVPDLLKPAYSFGGLSLSQIAKPYVDIWLQTRDSVGELIHAFSTMVLLTDVQTNLAPGATGGPGTLMARVAAFNDFRDNMNTFVLNKNTEDFKNVSVPLGGLHELQAQSQEHVASAVRIPLIKFTGLQPAGLNASAEGEVRAYYDTIAAYQNRFLRPNLTRVLNFVQLSLWGEIDPEIVFDFEGLWEMSEKEKADLQKAEAERNQTYVDMGVIAPEEVRGVVIDDPELPFGDLDPDDVPELKEEEEGGLIPPGGGRAEEAIIGEPGAEPGGPGRPAGAPAPKPGGGHGDPAFQEDGGGAAAGARNVVPFRARGAADELDPLFASLANDAAIEWNESKHPRDPKGEFTAGASAGAASHAAETGAGAPKAKGYGWHGGPQQHFVMPQFGLWGPPGSFGGGHWRPEPRPPLDPSTLKKVGPQMGSNPGGVFEDEKGRKFYVKEGRSKDHVRNELTAADLYDLAGAPTLRYRDVAGGAHIASEMEKLSKKNASELSAEEVRKAKRDFAAHAWTANYDAVGTGGDNLVAAGPDVFTVDLGGALEYRARGKPKGDAFGNQVTEMDTMRDPSIAPDASAIFGDITPAEFRESAARVTRISDGAIRAAVKARGGSDALADKMIARRDDIAKRAKTFGAEGDPKKKTSTVIFPAGDALPVKTLNGVAFEPWTPPADGDWNEVDGQMDIEDEAPLPEGAQGKQLASGLIIREKDGRVWLARPKGGFGGYDSTFPKGRVEHALSMQANAIKEAFEETGLKGRITGMAGDRVGDVTLTRYYLAEREGGDPSRPGEESEGVVLAPADKLDGFLNRDRDRKLAKEIAQDEEPGAPRTLYVNRPLLNAGDLAAWAREHGVKKLLPADDMHVTVAFSKAPLAWAAAGDGAAKVVAEGGERSVERLGNEGAVVLRFECPALDRDWRRFVDAGASWDHPGYKPHVTFTMGDVDVDAVEPYDGPLEFGPEEWDEIGNRPADWAAKAKASLVAADAFEEGKHPRGQPENKGQFGPGGGGGGQAKRTSAGRPTPRRGSGAVLQSRSQGAAQAAAAAPKHDSAKLLEKSVSDALAKATPKQKEQAADHDRKTKAFLASEPARKSMAASVKAFAAKHAAAMANYHLTDAIMLPGVHHVVEQAVSAIGLGAVPGLTLGATAVAAYAANRLIETYHLNLTGAKQLLAPVVRGMVDVLGNVKETSARIADLERRGLVGAEDAKRDDTVLDALIVLLLEVEKLGEEEPQAEDEAPFEESKHPRDAHGEFTSKGGEGGGGQYIGTGGEEDPAEQIAAANEPPAGEGTKPVSTNDIVKKANANAEAAGQGGLDDVDPLTSAKHKYNAAIQLGANYATATWATTHEEDAALKQVYSSTEDAWKALAEAEKNKAGDPQQSFKAEIAKIDNAEGEYADLDTNLKSAEAKVKAGMAHEMAPDDVVDALSEVEYNAIQKKYGNITGAYAEMKKADEEKPQGALEWAKKLLETGLVGPEAEKILAHLDTIGYGDTDKLNALIAQAAGKEAPTPQAKEGKTKFGGLWKVTGLGEKADIQLNAKTVLLKPTNAGQSYRQMMTFLINNAAAGDLDADIVGKLKVKLVEALYKASDKATQLGKEGDAKKINLALNKISMKEPAILAAGMGAWEASKNGQPPPAYKPPQPEPDPAPQSKPTVNDKAMASFKKAAAAMWKKAGYGPDSKGDSVTASEKAKLAAQHGISTQDLIDNLTLAENKSLKDFYGSIANAMNWAANKVEPDANEAKEVATIAPATSASEPPSSLKATYAEITKAKKTAPLQLQYVPNAPQTDEAQKLVDEFNAKWSGKEVDDDIALKKIADFKAMQQKMVPLMNAAQKAAAEQNAKIAAEAKKSQAEQVAKSAKETAKHAAQLEEYKKELGVGDAEAEAFEGLVDMLGGDKQKVLASFKSYATSAGHGLTGFEGKLIAGYKSDSSVVNAEMRKPMASWKSPKFMYAKILNKALSKLPGYSGVTIRNTPLSSELQMRYQPGNVVMEHGFTGTSKQKPNGVFSGNTRFYIKGIGKRAADISEMYGFQGEGEVLYQAHTAFHVDKVEGQVGSDGEASYKVYMTELEV